MRLSSNKAPPNPVVYIIFLIFPYYKMVYTWGCAAFSCLKLNVFDFFFGVSQLSPWLLRRSFKMTRKQRNSLCKSFSALLLDRTNNIQWSKDAIFHMPFMLHVQNVCSQHPAPSCLSGYCQGQTILYH